MTFFKKQMWVLFMALSFHASSAIAVEALTQDGGKIFTVGADGGNGLGGCFVSLQGIDFAALGLDCPGTIVSFDCANTRDVNAKSQAAIMFQTAQLAYVADKVARLRVRDDVKADGWCIATNIGVKN